MVDRRAVLSRAGYVRGSDGRHSNTEVPYTTCTMQPAWPSIWMAHCRHQIGQRRLL